MHLIGFVSTASFDALGLVFAATKFVPFVPRVPSLKLVLFYRVRGGSSSGGWRGGWCKCLFFKKKKILLL